jgi:hypothetical protein
MRKLFGFIFIFFILSLSLVSPVLAKEKGKTIVVPQSQTINNDYFGFADRVEMNGTINGDAYIAGGNVIVDGTINGDLLTAGGIVTISGKITGDVRAGGGNVQVTGADIGGNLTLGGGNANIDSSTKVEGSIVAGAGNLQLFAPIGKGATIGGGAVLLGNVIGSNVKVASDDLNLTSNAKIDGDLTYWSENDVNISEGATVSGIISKQLPKDKEFNKSDADFGKNVGMALAGLFVAIKLLDLFWLAIIGLLIVILFPTFSAKTADYASKKAGWALLFGFLTLILMPIIGMILFATLVGIPVAFLLLFIFMLIFWVGRVFAIFALGRFILGKLSKTNDSKPLAYLLGLLIYILLCLIPIVGFITGIIISLAGVGALVATKKETYTELRKKNLI